MKPFLYQIAEYYYNKLGTEISQYQFIFPSKRAALFFRHYLAQLAERPIFSPRTYTINDFITSLLPEYHTQDKLELLFDLYHIYHRRNQDAEDFDQFVYWGEIILKDFDTIDRYLIQVEDLYGNLFDYKEIFDSKEYLDEETQALLRNFFRGFELPAGKTEEDLSEYKRKFLSFWRKLYPLYQEFNQYLANKNAVYEGHIYRLVAEGAVDIVDRLIEEIGLDEEHKLVFCGLYAISPSERKILTQFKKRGIAEFCWDEQICLFDESQNLIVHPAVRCQMEDIRSLGQVRGEWAERSGSNLPEHIELISCSTTVEQVKVLPHILSNLNYEDGLDIAVILPNEQLLLPVVSSIPTDYEKLNITLGYPLDRTPIAVLVRRWTKLILSQQMRDAEVSYPMDTLKSLLEVPLLQQYDPNLLVLLQRLTKQKLFYLSRSDLFRMAQEVESPIGIQLLERFDTAELFLSSLEQLLERFVAEVMSHINTKEERDEEGVTSSELLEEKLSTFDIEFIYHYLRLCRRLHDLIRINNIPMEIHTALRLLDGLTQNINIPFEGDPLGGIQIMGMLEARALQFRNLAILTAQEGSLPSSSNQQSLIPHIIKKGFGLPTLADQEAIDAYIFYQAIGRAEQLTLLYSHQDILNGKGQESRYIYQLEYLYGCKIIRRNVQVETKLPERKSIIVPKTEEVFDQLKPFYTEEQGEEEVRYLSASSINQYLSCSLRFYYEQVLRIRQDETQTPLMESNDFGTILHNTMQHLYDPYIGKPLERELLNSWLKKGNTQISRAVRTEYQRFYKLRSNKLTPLAKLYCQMIESYARAVVQRDRDTPGVITYCSSEWGYKERIKLSDGKEIRFKGFIDRVDLLQEIGQEPKVRVIDYKTGKVDIEVKALDQLFSPDGRYKAMTQTMLYSEVIARYLDGDDSSNAVLQELLSTYIDGRPQISPQVFQLSKMIQKDKDYQAELTLNHSAIYYDAFRKEYLVLLREVLEKLFSSDEPFVQTDMVEHCSYCPFRLSCGR